MIVSFYSYKGGVGRTQLLANIASYLCYYRHRKILLFEWDLEAPGLHFYFGKQNGDIQSDGFIELLENYMNLMRQGGEHQLEDLPYFEEKHILKNLAVSKNGKGQIDLIPCANYSNPEYTQKINDFDWREFMELRDGNVYMDFLKTKLKTLDYDLILIDSRTGIADYSGLCNILMPDINVIVIAPTNQNFAGAKRITHAISEHPFVKEGKRKPFILPILSRIDESNIQKYRFWTERFQGEFGFAIETFLPKNLEGFKDKVFRDLYMPQTTLLYRQDLALGENIVFEQDTPSIIGQMAKNYEYIAKAIERFQQEAYLDFYGDLNVNLLEKWLSEKDSLKNYVISVDVLIDLGNLQKAQGFAKKGLQLAIQKQDKFYEGAFYHKLGDVARITGNYPSAKESYESASKILRQLHKENPTNQKLKRGLCLIYQFLGSTYQALSNDLSKALNFYEKSNQLAKELYDNNPVLEFLESLALSYQFLGIIHEAIGNFEEAFAFFKEYNTFMKKVYENQPFNINSKNGLSFSYQFLGNMYLRFEKFPQALEAFEKYYQLQKELYQAYPFNINMKHSLSSACGKLGNFYKRQDEKEKAITYFLECHQLSTEILEQVPTHFQAQQIAALAQKDLIALGVESKTA